MDLAVFFSAISSESRRISSSFHKPSKKRRDGEAPVHGGVKRRHRRPGSSAQAWHVVPWPVTVSGARGAASRVLVGVPRPSN
eukprot:2564121-Prymnesium_polylepis.1